MDVLEPRALTVEQAARAIGLGRTSFYALIDDGAIRTVKIGGRRVVPVDALDEFLDVHSTGGVRDNTK